jgi:hypothetical protein
VPEERNTPASIPLKGAPGRGKQKLLYRFLFLNPPHRLRSSRVGASSSGAANRRTIRGHPQLRPGDVGMSAGRSLARSRPRDAGRERGLSHRNDVRISQL